MDITNECKELLKNAGINSQSSIDFDVNGEVMSMTLEYIIETYMQASQESQLVFLRALQKASESGEKGIEQFFEGMGKLLLMTQLSDKFGV